MIDIPIAVWLALFSVIAAPVAAWSFKTVREANRVVTLDGKRLDTIAAQAEYIEALEQKCKALETTVEARDVTIATRDHEHAEEMRKALKRIDDLEVLVYQWNLVRDVQEKRAARHEAREVRTESRDAAADARQADRADRSEAREIARDAHDGIGG
jgi:hypothetical protein